ncbi:hypothetical protein B5X24_HaOG208151 [Helicoverpa armigera]|uniref:Uncharacterized protein n=1 Tax=Helicoverpa armigera TaxID=29058 RepID=A0A2W1BLV8_HELAM|nr:hypothetical protein B5X24_HaOG208151 [Helicoverpa armigera]
MAGFITSIADLLPPRGWGGPRAPGPGGHLQRCNCAPLNHNNVRCGANTGRERSCDYFYVIYRKEEAPPAAPQLHYSHHENFHFVRDVSCGLLGCLHSSASLILITMYSRIMQCNTCFVFYVTRIIYFKFYQRIFENVARTYVA